MPDRVIGDPARGSAPPTEPRRLLLVGAFRYPHFQGSQIYFQEQAIALRRAGAEVDLLTYAGDFPSEEASARWRALDGFHWIHPPRWTSPRTLSSGPNLGKPIADAALAQSLHDAIASSVRHKRSYDAVLTHNVEACLVAAFGRVLRPKGWPPIVYCAHTLMEHELGSYINLFKNRTLKEFRDSNRRRQARLERLASKVGRKLDTRCARHSQSWIALTQSSERVMKTESARPGKRIPPALPDPTKRYDLPNVAESMHRLKLERRCFVLYSGNLDGYQELEGLVDIERHLQELARARTDSSRAPELVVATHDVKGRRENLARVSGLRVVGVESEAEMQSLMSAAAATLVLRRRRGGFPIKIVNSLAWGVPPIVFESSEWGLTHDVDCLEADSENPAESMARAIDSIFMNRERASRLREGARKRYETDHRPGVAAAKTLALLDRI